MAKIQVKKNRSFYDYKKSNAANNNDPYCYKYQNISI